MQRILQTGGSMCHFLLLLIHLAGVESLDHPEEDGGWFSNEYSVAPREEGPCTVEIRNASLMYSEFIRSYAYSKPVIIQGLTNNSDFRAFCSKKNLLKWYGNRLVRLSTANTYSYCKVDVSFQEYVENLMKPQCPKTLGSGAGTGVPFHWHGPGYSEVVYGRKRWFLYPPDKNPNFHPNRSTLSWLLDIYPNLSEEERPMQCTIHPGEVLYFPDRWWHATLNLDTSVFISTFLG